MSKGAGAVIVEGLPDIHYEDKGGERLEIGPDGSITYEIDHGSTVDIEFGGIGSIVSEIFGTIKEYFENDDTPDGASN